MSHRGETLFGGHALMYDIVQMYGLLLYDLIDEISLLTRCMAEPRLDAGLHESIDGVPLNAR